MSIIANDDGERDRAALREPPLVVDLDGTLLASDVLLESLFVLAKKKPLTMFRAPIWLISGMAPFKQRIAREAPPDVEALPYNLDLLAYLDEEKQRGRRIVLATGADLGVARAVAAHLGCFDAVFASDGSISLRGKAKRDRLVAEFGIGGFDYAGNGNADRAVCLAARRVILVHPSALLRRGVAKGPPVERVFERDGSSLWIYGHGLRLNHWVKNALVFLPLVADHRLFELATLRQAALAFLAFSLCASALYLLNDLFDLADDRRHPHKSQRMLASGQLTLAQALLLIPFLLLGAAIVASALPPLFGAVLGLYFLLMIAYNLKLRDIAYLDVATLGLGYTLRVLGGAAAAGLPLSPWLLGFCFLFFAGLALLKRYADLVTLRAVKGDGARAHAYTVPDLRRIAALGSISGYVAVFLLAFHSATLPLPTRDALIWPVLALLLIWVTHMWVMARKGRIVDDPVAFALTDRVSRIVAVLSAATLLAAT